MFDNLSEKLNKAFSFFKNKGKLSESDVKAGMREVKLALLEADVNFKVVKAFVSRVSERCVGSDVLESLLPGQMVIKIVNEELVKLMGDENSKIEISSKPPTVVMMVGLQGSGKTTHSGKIASYMKKQGKNPLLVACDVYRPAAIQQLKVVGEKVNIPVFEMGNISPVKIAEESVKFALKNGFDMVFIDTAGRLHIDEVLMNELISIKDKVSPSEILLVVDSMTGQDAVNVAESFNEKLDITGVVLSKLDGDTRGGAALSVKYVTDKPIKFVGTGEKLTDLEPFYPDRMASRILGMGDVLTLIEKAEEQFDLKQAAELEKKIKENSYTLNDYLDQLRQIKKMGSLEQLISMIPGAKGLKDVSVDENVMKRTEAIILSMNEKEKINPKIINGSRRKRIALGSGTSVEDVNKLLKQFEQMNKMMKQFSGSSGRKKLKRMNLPFNI